MKDKMDSYDFASMELFDRLGEISYHSKIPDVAFFGILCERDLNTNLFEGTASDVAKLIGHSTGATRKALRELERLDLLWAVDGGWVVNRDFVLARNDLRYAEMKAEYGLTNPADSPAA